jgi:hypothetical protein
MMNRGAIALSIAVAMGACLTEEPTTGTDEQEIVGCKLWNCGENGAFMGNWYFHELHEGGIPNLEGFSLLDMRKGSNTYEVDVVGAQMRGVKADGTLLTGAGLIGAYMRVVGPDGKLYHIHIVNVSNVERYWVGPLETPPMETYELEWNDPSISSTTRALCKDPPGRLSDEGKLWTNRFEAAIFTGDRYDSETRSVSAVGYGATNGWFNIACAGSTPGKIHHYRYTTAGSTSTRQTTWDQRKTMMKVLVSDVLGTGESLTVTGTPLRMNDPAGWMPLPVSYASFEGYWGPNGAICIEHHRLSPTFDSIIFDPVTGVPTCSSITPAWPWGGWVSGALMKTVNP